MMNLYVFEVHYTGGLVSTVNIVAPSLVIARDHLASTFRYIVPTKYHLVDRVAA